MSAVEDSENFIKRNHDLTQLAAKISKVVSQLDDGRYSIVIIMLDTKGSKSTLATFGNVDHEGKKRVVLLAAEELEGGGYIQTRIPPIVTN